MDKFSKEYFQKKGSEGGKVKDAKKAARTLKEKYGEDYFKNLGKMKKKKT